MNYSFVVKTLRQCIDVRAVDRVVTSINVGNDLINLIKGARLAKK
jgi:hypothetical protein